jgi:16S rRNA (cytidine1402-2'-O)-methyltransferase
MALLENAENCKSFAHDSANGAALMSGFTIKGVGFSGRRLEPGLHVVATPIGNLGDITIRALETLASADVVACEDTRVTGRLLKHFGIDARMMAYHEHNAEEAGRQIVAAIEGGAAIALASDAGTPLISDPGQRLVRAARQAGLGVWPVPGPSAPIAALSASGMPSTSFYFGGFLPTKEKARKDRLRALRSLDATLVFFESPNRLAGSLADIAAELGNAREVAVCREITKLHEEQVSGTANQLAMRYSGAETRGEVVLVIAPPADAAPVDSEMLITELLERMSVSEAAAEAHRLTGVPKRELYSRALEIARRREKAR